MDRWLNKVALVTGASNGIGRAVAESLVIHGIKVVGIDQNVEKMKILADEWKSKPGKLIPMQCDLANESEILRTVQWIEKNLGAIEILINSAAVNIPSSLVEGGNIDDWRRILDVNVLGVVILIKEMLTLLKKNGLNAGTIININDICAWDWLRTGGRPISTGYLASKSALRSLTDHLRLELAQMQSNIKVISIIPGLVHSEMTEQMMREKPRLALKPSHVADAILLAIQTPETVLIQDLVITPVRDIIM